MWQRMSKRENTASGQLIIDDWTSFSPTTMIPLCRSNRQKSKSPTMAPADPPSLANKCKTTAANYSLLEEMLTHPQPLNPHITPKSKNTSWLRSNTSSWLSSLMKTLMKPLVMRSVKSLMYPLLSHQMANLFSTQSLILKDHPGKSYSHQINTALSSWMEVNVVPGDKAFPAASGWAWNIGDSGHVWRGAGLVGDGHASWCSGLQGLSLGGEECDLL